MTTLAYSLPRETKSRQFSRSCSSPSSATSSSTSSPSCSPTSSRNSSPTTTVSELSADSGVASEEELSNLTFLHLQEGEEAHLYANLAFTSSSSSLPPPIQFSDVSTAQRRGVWGRGEERREGRRVETVHEEEEEEDDEVMKKEEDLSLLLTSQNPTRIDVRTLRRNKVSWRRRWGERCGN